MAGYSVRKYRDGLYYIGRYNRFIGAWQRIFSTGYETKAEAEQEIQAMEDAGKRTEQCRGDPV